MTDEAKSVAERCHDITGQHISDLWDAVALVDSALTMVREQGGHDTRLVSLLRMASERLHLLDDAVSPAV